MKFVIAEIYQNYIDAHIAMGKLQSENIDCWLKDEATSTTVPFLSQGIGGIKLMVKEEDKEIALQHIRTFKEETKENIFCPACNSHNIELISTNRSVFNWFTGIFGFLLGNYAIAPDKKYHCFDCGHEFDVK